MTRTSFRQFAFVALFALSLGAAPAFAQDVDPALLPADHPEAVVEYAGPETVILEAAQGPEEFTVSVAANDRARERGLMFREELGDDEGMLFFYPQPQILSIWMKNTLIPLDILFVDGDGRIVKIVHNAVPGSLAPMRSGAPAVAVLEIKGGRAAELGLRPGTQLRHLVFGNMDAPIAPAANDAAPAEAAE